VAAGGKKGRQLHEKIRIKPLKEDNRFSYKRKHGSTGEKTKGKKAGGCRKKSFRE